MTTDTGTLTKKEGVWYVYPDNMVVERIRLSPLDVNIIKNGYALSNPNNLTVRFEIFRIDNEQYARIIPEFG